MVDDKRWAAIGRQKQKNAPSAEIIPNGLAFNALWRYIPVSLSFATPKNEIMRATRFWGG